MKIQLIGNIEGSHLAVKEKAIAIIVDTLRASTTIPVSMEKGLKEIYIAKEVEDARIAADEYSTILMGERGCIKLPGFTFGNSPLEIKQQLEFTYEKSTFTSSTGAKIAVESIGSDLIIIGSPINAKAVVEKIIEYCSDNHKKNVIIIPAFSEGSIIENELTEDQLGSLIIAKEFQKHNIELPKELQKELIFLDKIMEKETLFELFLKTKHGQKLVHLDFKKDVEFCSRINEVNTVPYSRNDFLIIKNGEKVLRLQK
ncbi:MAG: 2-phosphosulfolactate phosphatase [Candidatus Thorarchaeota archaeon]